MKMTAHDIRPEFIEIRHTDGSLLVSIDIDGHVTSDMRVNQQMMSNLVYFLSAMRQRAVEVALREREKIGGR